MSWSALYFLFFFSWDKINYHIFLYLTDFFTFWLVWLTTSCAKLHKKNVCPLIKINPIEEINQIVSSLLSTFFKRNEFCYWKGQKIRITCRLNHKITFMMSGFIKVISFISCLDQFWLKDEKLEIYNPPKLISWMIWHCIS